MREVAPLCQHCPLVQSSNRRSNAELEQIRDMAAEVYYGNVHIEMSDVPEMLTDDFAADQDEAFDAIDCLNRIYRNNCPTAEIGHIGGEVLGIVAREQELRF